MKGFSLFCNFRNIWPLLYKTFLKQKIYYPYCFMIFCIITLFLWFQVQNWSWLKCGFGFEWIWQMSLHFNKTCHFIFWPVHKSLWTYELFWTWNSSGQSHLFKWFDFTSFACQKLIWRKMQKNGSKFKEMWRIFVFLQFQPCWTQHGKRWVQ